MKRSELTRMVKEVLQELDEANVTGGGSGGATFTAGQGEQYVTPKAFSKGTKSNRGTKTLTKQGYRVVKRPKRPSNTKAFDYL